LLNHWAPESLGSAAGRESWRTARSRVIRVCSSVWTRRFL
jgi:hypothetical protein